MPATESQDDPPVALDLRDIDSITEGLPADKPRLLAAVEGLVARPLEPGHFRVVASKGEGRFEGTFTGMMLIPDEGESLPPAPVMPGDEQDN
jgi:hypothetical protein